MTYTDDHAVLPAKNILMGIAVICAVLFFLNVLAAHLDAAVGRPGPARAVRGAARPDLAGHRPAVPGRPDRGGQGGAVHRAEHRRHPGGVRPRGRRGRAVHQPGRRCRRGAAATAGSADRRRCRWSTRKLVAPDLRADSSRSAPTTPSRRCSTSTATRSTDEKRALVLGVRELDQNGITAARPELVQPAHRLHPRQRRDRGVRQPAPRGQHAPKPRGDPVGRGPGGQPGRAVQAVPRRVREPGLLRRAEPRLLDRRQGRRLARRRARPRQRRREGEDGRRRRRPRRTTATAASRSAASSARCCTPCGSATRTSCCRSGSTTTARSSTTASRSSGWRSSRRG